jgi:signal transduction histidine kinase
LLYSIAAEGIGRIPILALLVAGLGAVATAVRLLSATIISTIMPSGWPLPLIVVGALAAVVVAAWSLGRFVRVRKDYVRSLAERARQAEAEREMRAVQAADRERARIAREMHDVVSHSLAIIVAQAEAGRMAAGKDPALGVAVLPTIAGTGRAAMADMRSLLGVLRDQPEPDSQSDPREVTRGSPAGATGSASGVDSTDFSGHPAAPLPGLVDISALVNRVHATGLPVVLREVGNPGQLDPGAELAAYRVVQEALTNVVKHSRDVTSVVVQLIWTAESLNIGVVDDGRGKIEQKANDNSGSGGQGLRGMRERVEAAGGSLEAGMQQDRGFQVIAEIPVRSDFVVEDVRGSR